MIKRYTYVFTLLPHFSIPLRLKSKDIRSSCKRLIFSINRFIRKIIEYSYQLCYKNRPSRLLLEYELCYKNKLFKLLLEYDLHIYQLYMIQV